ncbi:MAG: hypothetical protein ABW187_05440 [Dokdonella sp.]
MALFIVDDEWILSAATMSRLDQRQLATAMRHLASGMPDSSHRLRRNAVRHSGNRTTQMHASALRQATTTIVSRLSERQLRQ